VDNDAVTTYRCSHCGNTVNSQFRFCPHCSTEISFHNTSGQGFSAVVPPEVQGWNWGAFFMPIIWGPFNEVWLSLVAIIPIGSFIVPILLGIKGNEWAWQCKRWESIENFKKTQHTWAIWGFISLILPVIMAIGLVLIAIGLLGYFRIIK
jgi:hypothetical protein